MDYMVPNPAAREWTRSGTYVPCLLSAIVLAHEEEQFALVMESPSGGVFWADTGYVEACWNYYVAKNVPYPMIPTHVLILDIVRSLGGTIRQIMVEDYDTGRKAFSCKLIIEQGGRQIDIGCRVSDGLAISVCAHIPVDVDTGLIGHARRP